MAKKLKNLDGSDMGNGLAVPTNIAEHNAIEQGLRDLELIDPDSIDPLDYRVLLKVASVDEMTEGGVFKPADTLIRELMAKTDAEYVSGGSLAFTDASGDFLERMPEAGDRILTTKYPGNVYRDKDNNLYRFANDKDVVAIVRSK